MSSRLFTYEIQQRFESPTSSDESFDEFLDRVLDEFEKIGIVADYLANLKTTSAAWTISVEAEDNLQGITNATTALRTALHAANCNTPDWFGNGEVESLVEDLATA